MGSKKAGGVSVQLEGVRRRFERWRRTRRVRSQVPESLWAAAVKMAGVCGVHRTARTLRVDYYSLRKRVEQEVTQTPGVAEARVGATFVELVSPTRVGPCECPLELENASGAKMRVHLKGVEAPDLAALSRSLWDLGSSDHASNADPGGREAGGLSQGNRQLRVRSEIT
jgi:hypothetical protein